MNATSLCLASDLYHNITNSSLSLPKQHFGLQVKATTAADAAAYPFYGVFGVYTRENDPWEMWSATLSSSRQYRRYLYNMTAAYLRSGGVSTLRGSSCNRALVAPFHLAQLTGPPLGLQQVAALSAGRHLQVAALYLRKTGLGLQPRSRPTPDHGRAHQFRVLGFKGTPNSKLSIWAPACSIA